MELAGAFRTFLRIVRTLRMGGKPCARASGKVGASSPMPAPSTPSAQQKTPAASSAGEGFFAWFTRQRSRRGVASPARPSPIGLPAANGENLLRLLGSGLWAHAPATAVFQAARDPLGPVPPAPAGRAENTRSWLRAWAIAVAWRGAALPARLLHWLVAPRPAAAAPHAPAVAAPGGPDTPPAAPCAPCAPSSASRQSSCTEAAAVGLGALAFFDREEALRSALAGPSGRRMVVNLLRPNWPLDDGAGVCL